MKNRVFTIWAFSLCIALTVLMGCKQDFIPGVKTIETGKVYLPDADRANALIPALTGVEFSVDTIEKTVNFSIPIYRGGFSDFQPFTVDISADNNSIAGLVQSGALPANTIALTPDDYVLANKDSVVYDNGIMKGSIIPKVKIASITQLSGKVAALGLNISNSSKFAINDSLSKVIIYFDVDSLLDEIIPPKNLIDNSKWQILRIANNDNVTFKINSDGTVLASGGNGGHQGIFQAVQVKANKKYKLDLHVAGSGATDTWFEVYVSGTAPTQGSDYSAGGIRLALNTWTGCGKTPFDGLLSAIKCVGSGNIISFPTTGTVYIVIKSGGSSLGTTGITISDVVFINQK